MTRDEAIEYVKTTVPEGRKVLVSVWLDEDIVHRAEERNIKLTLQEIDEVLSVLHRRHDAYIGINWITALKNDAKLIVKASSRAQKAVKYILNEQDEEESEEEKVA